MNGKQSIEQQPNALYFFPVHHNERKTIIKNFCGPAEEDIIHFSAFGSLEQNQWN
jgi:hypothetical protein